MSLELLLLFYLLLLFFHFSSPLNLSKTFLMSANLPGGWYWRIYCLLNCITRKNILDERLEEEEDDKIGWAKQIGLPTLFGWNFRASQGIKSNPFDDSTFTSPFLFRFVLSVKVYSA